MKEHLLNSASKEFVNMNLFTIREECFSQKKGKFHIPRGLKSTHKKSSGRTIHGWFKLLAIWSKFHINRVI